MSIKLRRWEEREQIRTAAEKTKYCLIFSREILYVTVVLCLNILWLKAVNEITARQTRTSLCKHDVIKRCSIEYLTTQIELLLPTFNSWTVHKIMEYFTLGLLSSLWYIYHSTTAYFFDPPCIGTVCLMIVFGRDLPVRVKSRMWRGFLIAPPSVSGCPPGALA